MKTRIACILLVVGGILIAGLFLYFSFDPKERFTKLATFCLPGLHACSADSTLFLKG